MGNITIQGDLTGDVPGGEVGGASNLTTVGAIPYVSASGVLNQTANLSFDVANNRLVLGSATVQRFSTDLSLSRASAGVLQVGDGGSNANGRLKVLRADFGTETEINGNQFNLVSGALNSVLAINFTAKANAGVTVYDGAAKSLVEFNQSSSTFRVYDQTATTGVTKAVIRAGAGQGTTNLTEWQNAAGTVQSRIASGAIESAVYVGIASSTSFAGYRMVLGPSQLEIQSGGILSFSSSVEATAAKDTGLARNAAGVLEINNGTAGTYRDLILRRSQHNGVTVADLPAAAAGNAGSIQYVTDASATTIGSTVAGGGANKVMVWSDGAAWKIFAS